MEIQAELEKEIGTEEPKQKEALQPKIVKIVDVNFRDTKKGKIVNCECKHPDKEEPINISSASYLRDKQVVTGGLWYSLDSKELIQKGSALATFMTNAKAFRLKELIGKEVNTELDEEGWLCFKSY